jgi:hypothetical protein
MFGAGLRIRGDNLVFVTASTTLDRLWHYYCDETWYISNSLPAILETSKLDLLDEYDYPSALISIRRGLNRYVRTIPTTGGDLHITYFHNLVFNNNSLV